MYGFKVYGNLDDSKSYSKTVKTSTVINPGDPISMEDGKAIVTTPGLPILGTYQGKSAVTGDGTVKIDVLCGSEIEYIIDNDNDTNVFATAGYGSGKAYDIIGTTGQVQVDTSSASATTAAKNLVCISQSPDASDTSLGLFKINKANSLF